MAPVLSSLTLCLLERLRNHGFTRLTYSANGKDGRELLATSKTLAFLHAKILFSRIWSARLAHPTSSRDSRTHAGALASRQLDRRSDRWSRSHGLGLRHRSPETGPQGAGH